MKVRISKFLQNRISEKPFLKNIIIDIISRYKQNDLTIECISFRDDITYKLRDLKFELFIQKQNDVIDVLNIIERNGG